MKKNIDIGLSNYDKSLTVKEIAKAHYNKTEIGNSIFLTHKKIQNHQEYKFFCTSYQGKDYVLVSPRHWNTSFSNHSDLINIALDLIGVEKTNIKKKLELYNTDFFQNAFHGTTGKTPKENIVHFCCLDVNPNSAAIKKITEVPKSILKVQKRLLNSLNQVIKSNTVKKRPITPLKPKPKKKQTPRPKPKRR